MGKHRAPTKPLITPPRVGATLALAGVGVGLGAATTADTARADAGNNVLNALIACESGGNNVKNPTSTASGYFQILDSTWRAFGGSQYASHAQGATFSQQLSVAQRIFNAAGGLGPWSPSSGCWHKFVNGGQTAPDWIAKLSGVATVPAPQAKPTQVVVTESTHAMAPSTYTVVRNDTLSGIGKRFGVSWTDLYLANRAVVGGNADLIFPGQVLTIIGTQATGAHVNSGPAHAAPFDSPLAAGSFRIGQPFKGAAHEGVDLPARDGTPEYAVTGSTVEFAGPAHGFGQWIVLTTRVDGMQVDFVYGHEWANGVLVKPGESVATGEHIGNVGANGNAQGAHLHFEVWVGGRLHGHPVDPIGWLRAHGVSI